MCEGTLIQYNTTQPQSTSTMQNILRTYSHIMTRILQFSILKYGNLRGAIKIRNKAIGFLLKLSFSGIV